MEITKEAFAFPLEVTTHERCFRCITFRKRAKEHDDLVYKGQLGPWVETAEGETIARGDEGVRLVLNAVLDDNNQVPIPTSCDINGCGNEPTHTVEVVPYKIFHRCADCANSRTTAVNKVDEGVEVEPCDQERCFNATLVSQDYCAGHRE